MQDRPVRKVVIVGGGTAGWVAAAALVKVLGPLIEIELVESDQIGTVGVGEATIPQIRLLNATLGIDENEFVARTAGTFKLGIEFSNWGAQGERYLHTFGEAGINLAGVHFHHYWLRHVQAGGTAGLWDFSLHDRAAYAGRFARMERVGNTPMAGLAYAFHFDAGLYAVLLREYSEARGVRRTEGLIGEVLLDGETGFIRAVKLSDGREVAGDLFIDCSGFRGMLIGDALGSDYIDWSHCLPVDRAWAVACKSTAPLVPYTKSIARGAGWQWRIPLQHRTGNGHVFSSAYLDEQAAADELVQNLDGDALGQLRLLRFTTGRRREFWKKNCVSLGLASGFMEPLESTSIHLVQSNVNRLINLFPQRGVVDADIAEYNRQVGYEFERIRDFLILHYKLTRRDDTEFWNYVRTMPVPESLRERMELFAQHGRIFRDQEDLFKEASWLQVMVGQGLMPSGHNAMADLISDDQLVEFLTNVRTIVDRAVEVLPSHQEFIAQTCAMPAGMAM
ncbi:MAG: tryptophan halogenase family protein [Hyphomonas sp.]|uniref:tryptophan halogenase family protein n=1 Tax=Hyphomonas sp. TaxID=87 RepID=UPI003528E39A